MVKDAILSPASTSPGSSDSPILHNKKDAEPYWPMIGTKDNIPGWLQDNDFIISGHPMPTHSYKRSFRLWRCLHMETMNIWTHLLGSAAFVGAGITLHRSAISSRLNLTTGDKFAFGISLSAAASIQHRWGRFDIFGICLLALGGGSSATYYAARCDPMAQRVYWCLNGGAAVAAAVVLFDTGGGRNKMRTLRGGTFSALAITAMLPIFHGIGKLGWSRACEEIGAQWYLTEGLVLLFGVSCFVGRQIHHICAVLGQAFHIVALVTGYRFRNAHPTC